MKPLTHRCRRRSGFTLIEMFFSLTIFGMIVLTLAWMSFNTTRVGNIVGTDSTLQSQGRVELDTFIQDAHASTQILTTYTNGSTTYNSDTSTTIILEAPAYNSSGIIAGSTDYIVYQLSGTTLSRITYAASGSSRTSGTKALASNVSTLSLTYLIDQQFYGDGNSTFTLNSAAAGTGTGLIEQVNLNGVAQTVGTTSSTVQFVAPVTGSQQGTLVFPSTPTAGEWFDALYSVDPTVALNQTYVTGVIMNLTLISTNPGLGPASTQTTVISGLTNLHNHSQSAVSQ